MTGIAQNPCQEGKPNPDTAWGTRTHRLNDPDTQNRTKYDWRKKNVNVMTPNDILSCLLIGAQPSCHQSSFTHQQMETYVDSQPNNVGGDQRILQKRGRKDFRSIGVKDITRNLQNQLNFIPRGSQKLNQPWSLRGTDLSTRHFCYNCVAWSSCEIPNSGNRGYLRLFNWLWDLIPHSGLPCPTLVHGEVHGLTSF